MHFNRLVKRIDMFWSYFQHKVSRQDLISIDFFISNPTIKCAVGGREMMLEGNGDLAACGSIFTSCVFREKTKGRKEGGREGGRQTQIIISATG